MHNAIKKRAQAFREVFTNPVYLGVSLAGAILYYYLFRTVITASSHGIFLPATPAYLMYGISLTSALLLAVSMHAVFSAFRPRRAGASCGVLSVGSAFAGSIFSSCGCSAPILGTLLYGIGVNSFAAANLMIVIGDNSSSLLYIILLIDLALLYFYLGRQN